MKEPTVAALVVRRMIRATLDRLFAFWTEPEHLVRWWGPDGVSCPTAEVDLRPGGRYRIANRFSVVVVTHERIDSAAVRTSHERGWIGCLDGLASNAQEPAGFNPP